MKAIDVHPLNIKMENPNLMVSLHPQRGKVSAHIPLLPRSCHHELNIYLSPPRNNDDPQTNEINATPHR